MRPVSVSAASMSNAPAPRSKGEPVIFRAERIRRALIVSGFKEVSRSSISAAAPATIGAAMLVPDISK